MATRNEDETCQREMAQRIYVQKGIQETNTCKSDENGVENWGWKIEMRNGDEKCLQVVVTWNDDENGDKIWRGGMATRHSDEKWWQ